MPSDLSLLTDISISRVRECREEKKRRFLGLKLAVFESNAEMVQNLFYFPHVPFPLESISFWGQDQDLRDMSESYWYCWDVCVGNTKGKILKPGIASQVGGLDFVF